MIWVFVGASRVSTCLARMARWLAVLSPCLAASQIVHTRDVAQTVICVSPKYLMEASQFAEVKASRLIRSVLWIKFMRNKKEKTFETRVINLSPQSQESASSETQGQDYRARGR